MKNNKPLYIFDLDGTLAKIDHRRHLVENGNNKWDEFYKQCVNDAPNKKVIHLFNKLSSSGNVYIFSGRSDAVEKETRAWLEENMFYIFDKLIMRKEGDFTPDDQLKKQWYMDMSQEDKDRLVFIVDDRNKVVRMWRSLGLTCLQCAEGEF